MKNFFKSLIFVTFMAMSGLASAVCYTNANQIPVGSLPLHPSSNGGALCTTKSEANEQVGGGQVVTLVTTQQQGVFQPVTAGQVFSNCTPQQEIHRAGMMALFGAAIGGLGNLLIKDNGRDAGKGAGVGLIGGTLYALGTECRVAVPQGTVAGQGIPGQTSVELSTCSIPGGGPDLQNMRGLTRVQCAAIEATQKTGGNQNLVFSNEGTGEGVCALDSNGTARLKSNPSKVVPKGELIAFSEVTKDSSGIAVIPKNSPNENCSVWRRRIAPQIVAL